jgi:hypothetical protein
MFLKTLSRALEAIMGLHCNRSSPKQLSLKSSLQGTWEQTRALVPRLWAQDPSHHLSKHLPPNIFFLGAPVFFPSFQIKGMPIIVVSFFTLAPRKLPASVHAS